MWFASGASLSSSSSSSASVVHVVGMGHVVALLSALVVVGGVVLAFVVGLALMEVFWK